MSFAKDRTVHTKAKQNSNVSGREDVVRCPAGVVRDLPDTVRCPVDLTRIFTSNYEYIYINICHYSSEETGY